MRGLNEICERRLLLRGVLQQEQHPAGGQGTLDRAQVSCGLGQARLGCPGLTNRSPDQRVNVAVKSYAHGVIGGALNARRGLLRRGRIARRSECGRDCKVQCNKQQAPDDGTQQFHDEIIGSARDGPQLENQN